MLRRIWRWLTARLRRAPRILTAATATVEPPAAVRQAHTIERLERCWDDGRRIYPSLYTGFTKDAFFRANGMELADIVAETPEPPTVRVLEAFEGGPLGYEYQHRNPFTPASHVKALARDSVWTRNKNRQSRSVQAADPFFGYCHECAYCGARFDVQLHQSGELVMCGDRDACLARRRAAISAAETAPRPEPGPTS